MIKECVREERKNTRDWNSISDLCLPRKVTPCGLFVGVALSMEPGSHTLLGVAARLPCHPAMLVRLMLLMCGAGPHSW
jgi:hypothetical protein